MAVVGMTAGGFLGAAMDKGNMFGLWSILFSALGGIAGIWLGVKINNYIGG